jgi:hypothetical protein
VAAANRNCYMVPIMLSISYTVKKRLAIFLYPAGDVPARESLVSDIPAGDGKIANLFLQCTPDSAYNKYKLNQISHLAR